MSTGSSKEWRQMVKVFKIESRQNPKFRRWLDCLSTSGIKKYGDFLLSGQKLVAEVLKSDPAAYQSLLVPKGWDTSHLHLPKSLAVYELPQALFKELDESGTHEPILVGRVPEIPKADLTEPPSGLELVLAMQNPLNLGAALRSAVAFGAQKVILLEECAHPYLQKSLRAGSGAALRIRLAKGPRLSRLTLEETRHLTALDLSGTPLDQVKPERNVRLIIGEEGQGYPENFSPKARLTIPMSGDIESLNAAVTAGIVLYALGRK